MSRAGRRMAGLGSECAAGRWCRPRRTARTPGWRSRPRNALFRLARRATALSTQPALGRIARGSRSWAARPVHARTPLRVWAGCQPAAARLPGLPPRCQARPFRARLAPDFAGGVDDQLELAALFVPAQQVALLDRGEAALRAQRQVLRRDVLRRLVDAS